MATAPSAPPMGVSKPVPVQAQDYEAGVPGHRHDRLPCCGLGVGWILFIIGFFLTLPWYAGAILLCFYRDKREKPGLIACTVAAVIITILIIVLAVIPHEAHAYGCHLTLHHCT